MNTKERHIRAALRKVGNRRAALKKAEDKLHAETSRVLRQAEGVVPMQEAAGLAGLSRSTAYQGYLQEKTDADGKRSTGTNKRPTDGRPKKGQRSQDRPRKAEATTARVGKRTPTRQPPSGSSKKSRSASSN